MCDKDDPRIGRDGLKRLKLTTLSYRCLREDMIETYKIITRVYDRDVTTGLFSLRKPSNTRGQQYKIFKEWLRLEVRKHSFFFQVTDSWNSLPNQVVKAPTVEAFERRLDRYWREYQQLYRDQLDKHCPSGILSVCKELLCIYCITSIYCKHTL